MFYDVSSPLKYKNFNGIKKCLFLKIIEKHSKNTFNYTRNFFVKNGFCLVHEKSKNERDKIRSLFLDQMQWYNRKL